MHSRGRLTEKSHDQSVGRINAREFHVVSQLIWRNSLEKKLAGVGILAFVALEWNLEKTNPTPITVISTEHENYPPCDAQQRSRTQAFALGCLTLHGFAGS